MQSSLLFLSALAGLAAANPMAWSSTTTQASCAGPIVSACKTNSAATPYCSSVLSIKPVTKTTTWTSTPPVVTDTALATNIHYTTTTYIVDVTLTSTVTKYPWTVSTCTPSPASSVHHKRGQSSSTGWASASTPASPVSCPSALKTYATSAIVSACSCLNLPTPTSTVTKTTVLPAVTTTTTLTIQTTTTIHTTHTSTYTTTTTSTAPTYTETILSTFTGNYTTHSSGLVMSLYPNTDFPTTQGFNSFTNTGSSLCSSSSTQYTVNNVPYGTCNSFDDCMNICAAYSESILAVGGNTAGLCRGVSYGNDGTSSSSSSSSSGWSSSSSTSASSNYCYLKSSVPGTSTSKACGQVNSWVESAVLDLP